MPKFGLGRGLADLKQEMGAIPDISVLTGTERVAVKQIPLVQIGANPDQPRKTFNEDELVDLAASIKAQGVLQPILLRAVQGRPHMYEIVAGERRYRASKMAGLSEIPALVKNLTDENAMEIALIENVQRENLNPIEEGAAYQAIMEKCGYTISDVSRLIGKSESYIRNIMRLGALPESVKEMVARGEISASHARTIAVSENPEQMAHEIVRDNLSVADAAKRVKGGARNIKARAVRDFGLSADEIAGIERRVSNNLGAAVKLQQMRGGAGRIIISYRSRMELDDLIKKIG